MVFMPDGGGEVFHAIDWLISKQGGVSLLAMGTEILAATSSADWGLGGGREYKDAYSAELTF